MSACSCLSLQRLPGHHRCIREGPWEVGAGAVWGAVAGGGVACQPLPFPDPDQSRLVDSCRTTIGCRVVDQA